MYYFPYKRRKLNIFHTYYSLSYGHLACRKSIKNEMLLLHNRAEGIIGIFHKKLQLRYNKRQNMLNVSVDHKVRNNVS